MNFGEICDMMPKKLKAMVAVALCVLLLLAGTAVCGAVSQAYTIKDIDDMSVTLPDGMTAVTRSSDSSDKYFSLFGLDYETTMANFKNGDIYLQGMNESSTLTITVTMTKTKDSESIRNYSLLERDKLTEVMGNFLTQSEYSSCTPDQNNDSSIVWLMFDTDVTTATGSIKAYQAHTVYDGMSINVTLQRNGSNVTNDDYSVFSGIVSSVSFGRTSFVSGIIPVIIIAAALIVIVLLLIFIIRLKHNQRVINKNKRAAESRNEQVLRELANKYNLSEKQQNDNQSEENVKKYTDDYFEDFVDIGANKEKAYESRYIQDEEYEHQLEDDIKESCFGNDNSEDSDTTERYVSDEEIDEILSGAHSFDESTAKEVYREKKSENSLIRQADELEEENVQPDESEQQSADESEAPEIDAENSDNDDDEENLDLTADGLTELDEFNNDEVLVREESNQSKFEDSYDFFEEAPKKKMGIISNKELDKAEDYDVISEIEQRASKVSREEPKEPSAGEKVLAGIKAFGRGVKSFGVHCGYFCTNVYRMIKRKRMIAKRRKAEQERLERARERAERQRQVRRASEDGSLVKVHSRTDRRPSSAQTRRPSAAQARRKPSTSQTKGKR